jgi:hypothetical protein
MARVAELNFENTYGIVWVGIMQEGEEEEGEEEEEGLIVCSQWSDFGVSSDRGEETAVGGGVMSGGLAAWECVAREVDTEDWWWDSLANEAVCYSAVIWVLADSTNGVWATKNKWQNLNWSSKDPVGCLEQEETHVHWENRRKHIVVGISKEV